jgi:hypothetical protein
MRKVFFRLFSPLNSAPLLKLSKNNSEVEPPFLKNADIGCCIKKQAASCEAEIQTLLREV